MSEVHKGLLSALGGFLLGSLIFWIAGLVAIDRGDAEYQRLVKASEERERDLESAIGVVQERLIGSEGIISSLGSDLASTRGEVEELRKQIPRIGGKLADADAGLERAEIGAGSIQGLIDEALRQLEGAIGSSQN